MAISKVKSIFSTYTFDDSVETKNYHRVLFRPGVSVQARELTELQTNLQRQIDYHGQYSFVDGSRVTGGELALDVEYDYVKLESTFTDGTGTYNSESFITTIANTVGTVLTNANGVEAEVIQIISEAGTDLKSNSNKSGILSSGNSSDPLTIYIKYIKGSGTNNSNLFSIGEVLTSSTNANHKLMVGEGTNIDNAGEDSTIQNAIGQGSKITINEGVYFMSGSFVYVSADNLILDKYSNIPNNIIGLNVLETVVSAVDDPDLVDNAQGFPNASAPGADRYKISTQLIKEPLDAPNTIYTNYLTLLRVQGGIIQKKIAPAAEVDTELTHRFANRTYEESGNYSLKPFVLDIKEHLDNGSNNGYLTAANGGDADKYVVGIEPNVAYVQGFRTENISTKFIEVDKPRETSASPFDFVEKESTTSSLPLGNYIRVQIDTTTNSVGLPDINNFRELALVDSSELDHVALVDTVNDSTGATPFQATASTGRATGIYNVTDTGASGTICTSNTAGGGQGTGAEFKITIDQSKFVSIEVTEGGDGYHVDNVFTVKGSALGGTDTTHDLTFNVAQLGVGRARCRAVTPDTTGFLRLYLFDIIMTKGSFAQVDRVEQLSTATDGSAANSFHAILPTPIGGTSGKKYLAKDNSYIWSLPHYGIKTTETANDPKPIYQIQKKLYVDSASADNAHTFSNALAIDETLISTTGIVTSIGTGTGTDLVTKVDATASAGTGNDSQNITINHDDIASGESLAVIIVVQKTGAGDNRKNKTFNQEINKEYTFDGNSSLLLDAYDIYKLHSVKLGVNGTGETDGNATDGDTQITLTSATSGNAEIGMGVVGVGIVNGTTITDKSGDTITLSIAIEADINTGSTLSLIGADVTDKFDLDNGQTANYYGEGKLIPLQKIAAGKLYVTFDHYTHSSGEYLVKDSYPVDNAVTGHYLKDIPKFSLPSGEEVDLKDCVDFRPVKATTGFTTNQYGLTDDSVFDYTPSSGPGASVNSPAIQPASQFIFNGQIWFPRIDKIVLGRDGEYQILKGVSSEDPVEIEDPSDCMVIGVLKVKPFTYDARVDIIPEVRNYKRYTMKNIADIDKRLKKLEYYTSLSLQEQATFNISLNEVVQKPTADGLTTYEDTVERFKNGIFTDQFKGHGNAHVTHPNYFCSIDRKNNVVRPMFDEQCVNLVRKPGDNGAAVHNRSTYSLPYTSVSFINQPNATETEFINPYNMFVWTGTCRLSPDTDEWKDVEHLPDVIVNSDGNFNQMVELYEKAGLVGQWDWGEWETDWVGTSTRTQNFTFGAVGNTNWRDRGGWWQPGRNVGQVTTTTTRTGQSRVGTMGYIKEDTVTTESGDKVVEVNYIPFIRSREVYFTAELLKPNTKLYAFFNGVNVTNYCAEKAFQEFTDRTNVRLYTNQTQHTLSSRGQLTTDASGRITGSFLIPNTEALKFKTGERIFKLTDSPSNDTASLNDEMTYAEATYRAQGLIESKQNTIVNTKVAQIAHREITENRVITERNVNDQRRVTWFDPLAQSILITEKGGCFVTELDIFLNTADPSIPINVSIREMLNGYPTQKVVPGSDTVIYPSTASSGTTNANTMVAGKKYRIMTSGSSNFTSVGAPNNNVGTVFRVSIEASQSAISALGTSGKVDEINVLYTGSGGNGPMISDNASAALPVTFSNPVYLSQDQEYAIVLMSNSDIYKLFVTTPGKNDLTTGALVDGNHYGGSFFMSQNASTWTADPKRDLKFKLYKAQFESNATLTFVNDKLPVKDLVTDPFLVCTASATNSAVLRVSHPNHGMMEGSGVTIAGATSIGSLTASQINGYHVIRDVERDSYALDPITFTGTLSENSYGGGDSVTATENMMIDAFVPYTEMLNLPETSVSAEYSGFSGRSQDNTTQGKFVKTVNQPLTFNKTNYLDNPLCIASSAEHNPGGGLSPLGGLNNDIATNKSFGMTISLSTTNTNLTPIIDGDRTSLFCISNRTNSAVTSQQIGSTQYNKTTHGRNYVADTAAKGNSNLNAYITKEVTLANEATHLNFFADVFKPVGSDVIVYYKAQTSGDDVPFDDLQWTRLEPLEPIPADDTNFGPVEYEVNLADVPEVTDTFTSFAFKVVFVATNSSRVPMISDLRAIAST